MEDDVPDGPVEALTALVAVVTLPAGILAAIFLGGTAAAVVFVVGWLLLVPVLAILSQVLDIGSETAVERQSGPFEDEEDEALQELRERYASGEIDEAEFERRVERLLETDDLDTGRGTAGGPERSLERESE